MAKEKKQVKTTEELLEEISRKLNGILYLLGKQLPKEEDPKEEVVKLNKLGFNRYEIAYMLQTTPGNVSVILHRLKKGKSNGKTKKSK